MHNDPKRVVISTEKKDGKSRFIIPPEFNTIVSIGMTYSIDATKSSGVAKIFDGDIPVIEIDKKLLAQAIQKKVADRKSSTGTTRLYDLFEDASPINYTRANGNTLSIEGDYKNLVFWMY